MKKSYLKKKGKNPKRKLQEKIDRDYQDFFRSLCAEGNIKCEISGAEMELCHHFIPKSQSTNLRYDIENLVPVSGAVHSKFQFRPDIPNLIIIGRRGLKWAESIRQKADIPAQNTITWLTEQEVKLEYLKIRKEDLIKNYKKLGYFKL